MRIYTWSGFISKTTHSMAERRGLEITIEDGEDKDVHGTRQRVLDIADLSGESDFNVSYKIPTEVQEFENGEAIAILNTTTVRGVPHKINVGDERELRLLIKDLGERIAA